MTAGPSRRGAARPAYVYWTPEEDAVALDRSLSASEAARMLGRTVVAVNNRRRKLRNPERERQTQERYKSNNRDALLDTQARYRESHRAKRREWNRTYRAGRPESVQRASEVQRQQNEESRRGATRQGVPWSESEDLALQDRSRTAAQLATELGRSVQSVNARRRYLRRIGQNR